MDSQCRISPMSRQFAMNDYAFHYIDLKCNLITIIQMCRFFSCVSQFYSLLDSYKDYYLRSERKVLEGECYIRVQINRTYCLSISHVMYDRRFYMKIKFKKIIIIKERQSTEYN